MISPLEFEQRRTDSVPTPTCLATTAEAAVTEEYSPRWSLTRRTARAFSSSSIFLGMVLILSWTQTGAASNLGLQFAGGEDQLPRSLLPPSVPHRPSPNSARWPPTSPTTTAPPNSAEA